MCKLLLILVFQVIVSSRAIQSNDSPLILTPYIENNKTSEAKSLSEVKNLPNSPSFESYSGFFTVDRKYNSNLFFWFFPSQRNPKSAPVLVYLEGGPGVSSLFSVFGYDSLQIDKDLNLTLRPFGLIQEFSVIYIDNPVGTGFSYTEDEKGFSNDENSVADNLYECLKQFYQIFSEYRKNPLYVIGESYGGKYAPALGYKLMVMSNKSDLNFKGIAIGNGWTDPITQIDNSNTLKSLGLVDSQEYESMRRTLEEVRHAITTKNWTKAFEVYSDLIFTQPNAISLLTNYTGYPQFYNILRSSATAATDMYEVTNFPRYLALNSTLEALHVGNRGFSFSNSTVNQHLREDFMQSMEPNLTALVRDYRVLLYTGNLDLTVSVEATVGMLDNKNWKYWKDYYTAERIIYKVSDTDPEIAGYVKTFGNFSHVIVRNAGHCVPADQPRVGLDLMKRFVYSKPFTN